MTQLSGKRRLKNSRCLIWNYGGHSGNTILSALHSAERQKMSTQNSLSNKNILQELGKITPLSHKRKTKKFFHCRPALLEKEIL